MRQEASGFLAPAFQLKDPHGRTVPFQPDAPGLKVLIFYKNTCPTCQWAMPYFDRLYTRVKSGARILAISQDTPEEALAFASAHGVEMPQLVDEPPYPVSRQFGILNVPTLLLVDETGRTALVSPAFIKADVLTVLRKLNPGAEADVLFAPEENVPELRPG